MSENTILAIAQSGIQNGMAGLKKNASQLASKDFIQPEGSTQPKSSAINELVEMKMNKYQVLTSGKVIQTVDEMLGSLLDETV